MDFAKTVLLTLSVLLTAMWVGMVVKADGEDKLKEACHPISMVMEGLADVTEGLTGLRPQWTIKAQQVLEGGCYYFFSIILTGNESSYTEGGVRSN